MSERLTLRWRARGLWAALFLPPLVHLVSLSRLTRWIERRPTARDSAGVSERALADWVDRLTALPPPPWRRTCLKRALVLLYLIRRAGGGSTAALHLGVRRDATGALQAHAWLVRDGQALLEPANERLESFQVLASFPGSARDL